MELDKMVDKSGSGRALHPLCQTGHALCLPTTAACGGSLGMGGCGGPNFARAFSDRESLAPMFAPAFPDREASLDADDDPPLFCGRRSPNESSGHRTASNRTASASGSMGPMPPFVEIQSIPVLPPVLFEEALPGPATSGPLAGGGIAVHCTSSAGAASSASLSSMPGELPGEATAQGVPVLAERPFPRRERSDRRLPNMDVGREGTNDSGTFFTQWRGRCGFVARVRPETPEGPWMCHHFTLDGEHCVGVGLGPEHANSCAGTCRMIETETFEELADPPRCMGLRKPIDHPGCPTLIKCTLASSHCCTTRNCPFP